MFILAKLNTFCSVVHIFSVFGFMITMLSIAFLSVGNIVVHFMLDETRQIYQIEKLWTLGHEYDDMYNEIRNYLKDDDL